MEQVFNKISEKRFSEKEAAQLLQVSPMTVRRYRDRGELGFYQLGSRIFIGESHITAFLEKSEIKASVNINEDLQN